MGTVSSLLCGESSSTDYSYGESSNNSSSVSIRNTLTNQVIDRINRLWSPSKPAFASKYAPDQSTKFDKILESLTKQEFLKEFKDRQEIIFDLEEWRNRDGDSDRTDYFYHYTTIKQAKLILNTNLIKMSHSYKVKNNVDGGANCNDKFCGVYLTNVRPDYSDSFLLRTTRNDLSRLKCTFAIKKSSLKPKPKKLEDKFSRDIWKYENDIDLSLVQFKLILRSDELRLSNAKYIAQMESLLK